MSETKLIEKLKLIEVFFAGAATEGEDGTLTSYLDDIKNKVMSETIHSDNSETEVVKQINWKSGITLKG